MSWPTAYVKVNGTYCTMRYIGKILNILPNSANARVRRLQRTTGRTELTWDELKRGSRGYVYLAKMPRNFPCRNELRRKLSDRGMTFENLAERMGTTRGYVNRVLGRVAAKSRATLTPEFVQRCCEALELSPEAAALVHELGAREVGWRIL